MAESDSQSTECPLTPEQYAIIKSQDSGKWMRHCANYDRTNDSDESVTEETRAFSGKYGFQLNFAEELKAPSKSCDFTYSSTLNKLYVQRKVNIPVRFKTRMLLSETFSVVSYLRYKEKAHRSIVVKRCSNHVTEEADPVMQHHVLTAHEGDHKEEQSLYFVRSRPTMPQNSSEFHIIYRWSCASTCRGSICRRPIQLVCELYLDSKCTKPLVGRVIMDVNISSCPGRDRKMQEEKHEAHKASICEKCHLPLPKSDKQSAKNGDENPKEKFTVIVRGTENAELFRRILEKVNQMDDFDL